MTLWCNLCAFLLLIHTHPVAEPSKMGKTNLGRACSLPSGTLVGLLGLSCCYPRCLCPRPQPTVPSLGQAGGGDLAPSLCLSFGGRLAGASASRGVVFPTLLQALCAPRARGTLAQEVSLDGLHAPIYCSVYLILGFGVYF